MVKDWTSGKHANRLIDETSPYLLQHADNPVHWYPWGAEAFDLAGREDKPVFLSIGYSTCHWCHVMKAESFEDEATAAVLNEHFIAIKVDREERPDVDETYMKAVQMLTWSGGWPLSVFLTPDGKPFYGGTYFPPRNMYGRPSFQQVLLTIADAWRDQRHELLRSALTVGAALQGLEKTDSHASLSSDMMHKVFTDLSAQFDEANGGFGAAPKFPQPSMLAMLLTYWRRTGNERALHMVTRTLDAMMNGGIHDHLAGGFHRYSTDAQWLVPHFEKMLYDQAHLSKVYLQAYQATGQPAYAAVARDVLDYVRRDMTDADGGFYAAEDADSEGREGTFYVWDRDEIEDILGADAAKRVCTHYGVTESGNFEEGKSILHVACSVKELGSERDKQPPEMETELAQARMRLLEHRTTRPRPHRDDKIITAWNGLMISSLAYGGAVLGDERYIAAASRAADFVLGKLRVEGRLMRYHRAGRAVEKGFLDDYAFMIAGLLDLYEASFDARPLREAATLTDQMIDLFADGKAGGFYLAGRDAERLITRDKPGYDGALPSGNSVAALALLKLGRLTETERFSAKGQEVLEAFSGSMRQSPTAFTAMMVALEQALGPAQEIVIAGSQRPAEAAALVRQVRSHFLPNAVLVFHPAGTEGKAIEQIVPFVANLGPVEGRAAAYVCENYTCRQPVTKPEDLDGILDEISRKN